MCHTPILDTPRRGIAEANGDFEWFKHMVYDHTKAMPEHCEAVGPGNPVLPCGPHGRLFAHAPAGRSAEADLRLGVGLGLEIPITTNISAAEQAPNGFTYKIDVVNKGVEADNATIARRSSRRERRSSPRPAPATRACTQTSKTKATVAEWQVAKLLPNDKQSFSITLLEGGRRARLKGSIHWTTRGGRPAGPKDFVEIGGEEKKEPKVAAAPRRRRQPSSLTSARCRKSCASRPRSLAEADPGSTFSPSCRKARDPMLTSLDQSAFSTWLLSSNSIWAYPTVLTLHTFGMMVLVGAALMIDLRLLGFGRGIPLQSLDRLFRVMWGAVLR